MGSAVVLLVYTKKGIEILAIVSNLHFNQHCKFLIKDATGETTFYLIYRSPNATETENNNLVQLIEKVEEDCFLIGDFNLPDIDWGNLTSNSSRGKRFLERRKRKTWSN